MALSRGEDGRVDLVEELGVLLIIIIVIITIKKKIKALLRSIHRIALHPNKLTKLIYAKKLTNS